MATLGFGLLGTSATTTSTGALAAGFTPLGAAALIAGLSIAGAVIDQKVLFPALGLTPKPPDIQGQRIDDLQLSLSSEGTPKNFCLGPKCKVPGTILWISELEEFETRGQVGGGKSAQDVIEREYFVNLAIGFSTDRVIQRVTDLWANGELVYTQTNQPSVTSTSLAVAKQVRTFWKGFKVSNNLVQFQQVTVTRMIVTSPNGGPDLSAFRPGVRTTVSNFGTGVNNGTFDTISSSKSAFTGVSQVILDNPNVVTESAGANATMSQEVPTWDKSKFLGRVLTFLPKVAASVLVILDSFQKFWSPAGPLNNTTGAYDGAKIIWTSGSNSGITSWVHESKKVGGTRHEFLLRDPLPNRLLGSETFDVFEPDQVDGLAVYKGDQMAVDPTIEIHEGNDAKVWANEGYAVLDRLNIKDFGNTVPVSWAVLVEADVSITVGDAIGKILERADIDASRFDVTALTENLEGYFYSGARATLEALNPLFIAFDLLTQERNGVLYFFKRANASVVSVDADDLVAKESGSAVPPKPVLVERLSGVDLPAEVQVEFVSTDTVDTNKDPSYEKGVVRTPRNLAAANVEVVRQVLDRVTMSEVEAKKVANRILWTMHSSFRQVSFQLPPSYLHLLENDIASIPFGDGTKKVLVNRLNIGHNGLIVGQGLVHEDQTLSW